MKQLTDESPMPWGMHKNKKMIDVPAGYLLKMYHDKKVCKLVKAYVEDNMDVLEVQVKRQKEREQKYGKNFY